MPVVPSAEQPPESDLQRQLTHLQEAIVSHERIGFATGLLAQRFRCTPEQAWQLMVRLSQTTNIKVRTIARVLTDVHCCRPDPDDADVVARIDALLLPHHAGR